MLYSIPLRTAIGWWQWLYSPYPLFTLRYKKSNADTMRDFKEQLICGIGMRSNQKRVLELHSYEVPEILAVPILAGSALYLS
jgi:CutA1 divalent ion tolerance protein